MRVEQNPFLGDGSLPVVRGHLLEYLAPRLIAQRQSHISPPSRNHSSHKPSPESCACLISNRFIPLFGEKVRMLKESVTLQPEKCCWRWQGNARASTVSVTRGAGTHIG